MASNKTKSVKKVAPKAKPKTPAKIKAAPKAKSTVKVGPRHPKGRVTEKHSGKAELAKTLASVIARADQDTGALEARLKTASNAQLLRLHRATQTLKDKYGSRDKLIAAIGTATNKAKDKDYLAKLDSYSLPQLLDLAAGAQRAARS
ncbi:MAG TPA: hypothetical protein VH165_24565 [Kofleriaceae bacterium]|jgi:hypothetical protein|nr:hypothetical protein [Kofleriaceae bacterium]